MKVRYTLPLIGKIKSIQGNRISGDDADPLRWLPIEEVVSLGNTPCISTLVDIDLVNQTATVDIETDNAVHDKIAALGNLTTLKQITKNKGYKLVNAS